MAIYCCESCEALCDFCIYFDDDKSICTITGEELTPSDFCEDNFHCFRASNKE